MTDLDTLKRVWQEPPDAPELSPIGEEDLMALIQARTADIKQRTMNRVRTESYNYLILVLIPVVMLLWGRGLTMGGILASVGVLAALGPILGTLAYKEYSLRSLPRGGSLKESLEAIVAAIDSTSRVYMFTYMLCVIAGVASAAGVLAWRYGMHWIPMLVLVGGMAFLVWAYRSGQAYVGRMFGAVRSELTECLSELGRSEKGA